MSELPQEKIAALLAEMWQRNRPAILGRLDLLERAATDAKRGCLSAETRAEAVSTAHNLAGTLGTFGFPRGTELARLLEQSFEQPNPDPELLLNLTAELRATLFPQL